MEETNPAARLAEAHRDRLLIEDRLREELIQSGFVIDVAQIEEAVGGTPVERSG
jgi:hypothetical protein